MMIHMKIWINKCIENEKSTYFNDALTFNLNVSGKADLLRRIYVMDGTENLAFKVYLQSAKIYIFWHYLYLQPIKEYRVLLHPMDGPESYICPFRLLNILIGIQCVPT